MIVGGIGCAAIVALTLITEPVYGAILLAAEIGVEWGCCSAVPRRALVSPRGGEAGGGSIGVLVVVNRRPAAGR